MRGARGNQAVASVFAGGSNGAAALRLARESWKYLWVSALALGVDYALLILLTRYLGLYYLVAAAVSFCAGLIVNYALSVRFVFEERSMSDRRAEFLWFCIIGLFGLILNEFAMAFAVQSLGLSYVMAKLPAAGLSFVFNFIARRALLFTRRGVLSAF